MYVYCFGNYNLHLNKYTLLFCIIVGLAAIMGLSMGSGGDSPKVG